MKSYTLCLSLFFILVNLSCKAQEIDSRIEVTPVTIQNEATSIWRTINDITFFEKQGYTINLPKSEQIDSLIVKSKNGTFGNEDFTIIYNLLDTEIFHKEYYKKAIEKVNEQSKLINSLINQIDLKKKKWDWSFKSFDKYKIIFTLYGTGGSYDPNEGTITLLTTKEGDFMNYQNPANTIIHEITHMGIESSIVQKYNVAHVLKERIVDTFVYLMFKEYLPNYKIQDMGETKIDDYLKKREDLNSLDSIVSKVLD